MGYRLPVGKSIRSITGFIPRLGGYNHVETESSCEVFATKAWFIWSHRNKSRLQEKSAPLSGIREAVCNFLQLFNSFREHSGSTKVVRRRTWQPLNPGEYKTNFDGAMFNECNEVGVGIVVRDSKGLVVVAMAEKIKKKTSFSGMFGAVGSKACYALRKGNRVTTVPL